MPRVFWLVFTLGAIALVLAPIDVEQRAARVLPRVAPAAEDASGPFGPAGVYPTTNMAEVPRGIATHGSWLGSDALQGTQETGWFTAAPRIVVLVAGYPTAAGNTLEVELRRSDGTTTRLAFAGGNPREMWQPWSIALPADAEAVRVRAVDGSVAPGGWLGFSEPFVVVPRLGAQALAIAQLATVVCLALTLVYGPGLLWFQARGRSLDRLAYAVVVGPLLLVALGLVCWLLGGIVPPAVVARVGVIALLTGIAWRACLMRRVRLPGNVSQLVAAGALLVGFGVAKANYSGGPAGELFRHTISRSLAVGGHSDSRIPYQVAQLVAHHFPAFGEDAAFYFNPWSFGSRGPLAGLACAPVMLATGARPPKSLPDSAWQPFDREGFATYRATMIVLASLAAWAVFAVVARFASSAWAFVGAIFTLLTPFFVHELYFTWPKLIAAALVLVAFVRADERRAFSSGVLLGVGYLFHPLALLSAPFLALWLAARADSNGWWRRALPPLWCAAGVLALVVPWQVVGRWHPGEGATAQAIFLHYFRMADNAAATWPTWWQSRWHNVAHTFLPGYLLTANPAHESLNSYYGPSDAWVRTSFLYWNTLPFALGLPGFVLAAAAIASATRRAPALVAVTVGGPALLLVAYWGAASTGLMRHCGHVLFLSVIALATWSLSRWPTHWRERATALLLHPGCYAWRGFEIAFVAFGTTLLNHVPDLGTFFGWNDILSLALALLCLGGAVILLAKTGQSLRSSLLPAAPRPSL